MKKEKKQEESVQDSQTEIDKELEEVKEKEVDLEKSEETLENKDQEIIQDLTDTVKRVQAEFENYKKRSEIQKQEAIKFAAKHIITQLLPVLDNFEIALKHKTSGNEELCSGFEMIYHNLLTILNDSGLEEIDAVGKEFNPYEHEALFQEESEEKTHTILEVLQKGYRIKDKVIRHAKVKIAK